MPWDSLASLETQSTDAAADDQIDRKSFRPGPDRRWLIAGAAVMLLGVGAWLLSSSGGDAGAHKAAAAEGSAANQHPASADSAWADVRKSLDSAPPAPQAAPPGQALSTPAESVESLPLDEPLPQGSRSRRRRPMSTDPRETSGEQVSGKAGPHDGTKPLGDDYDPLAERQ